MQKNNYYKGLVDGLNVGIDVLKKILDEPHMTIDDVLDEYNKIVAEGIYAYEKMLESQEQLDLFGETIKTLGGKQ